MLAPAQSLFDQSALTERAEKLVKAALAAGADAADAVAVRGLSQSIEVRDGQVEESESSEGDDLGLRVLVGKRQAVVSTNDTSPDGFATLAERAVAMARVAPEDKFAGLADPELLAHDFPDLDLIDDKLPAVADLEAMARKAEEAALAVKGVSKSGGASASAGIGGMVLVTSHGFRGAYLGSRHGVSVMAIAGEGTGMERDYEFSSRQHFSDLDAPDWIGRTAAERAVKRIGARKAKTGPVDVVFDPRVARGIAGHLAGAVNGASVARKTSFLRDMMGKPVASAGITVTDEPLRVRGQASRPFDGEGVEGERLLLVENGVLNHWLLSTSVGRELGLATNGRGARRGSQVSLSSTHLTIEPGARTPLDMIRSLKSGFYVTEGFGQGVNMVTGEYSRGASGFWIENGALAYPVSEVTIASNLKTMFLNMEPANDLDRNFGTAAPTLMITGMTLAGS